MSARNAVSVVMGQEVLKLSPAGKVLTTIGKEGVSGNGPDTFDRPTGVAVAPKPTPADRATVQNLAALGATRADIAMCIGTDGISEKTLRKHFRPELRNSLSEVKALAMSQVVAAMRRGEPWAVCFFLKCRGGWSESHRLQQEVTGKFAVSANADAWVEFLAEHKTGPWPGRTPQ